jgi:hypothetical protein
MTAINEILTTLSRAVLNFPKENSQLVCPRLKIPPYGRRNDSSTTGFYEGILNEAAILGFNPKKSGEYVSCITTASSPHTPIIINDIPAHLIVWWWQENNGDPQRLDFLALSKLPPEERKKALEIISGNITNAVNNLSQLIPVDSNYPEVIEIYGLVGHAKPKERQATGFSRGAQSNPAGHINVVYHPYEKYQKMVELKPITPEDFLKHAGIMDTIIMKNWGDFFVNLIRRIIGDTTGISLSNEIKHAVSQDQVSLYEGIKLNYYQQSIPLEQALSTICEVVNFFNNIYEILKQGYENYWKNIGNDNCQSLREEIINQLMQAINSSNQNDKKQFEQIVDFALSFKPTYGQLVNFLQDGDLTYSSRNYLQRLKDKYEKRRIRFSQMSEEEKSRLVQKVAGFYAVNKTAAESLITLITNQIADPAESWQDIKFTWPFQISLAYMIEDYEITNEGINAKKITIAPRFMSDKGVFEDIAGAIIEREQAK